MTTKGDNGQDDGADVAKAMAKLIAPLSLDQIETLAIRAIREHRNSLAKAESAYAAWKTGEGVSDCASREEYTKLMLAARAQQMVVATLIDRLGYVPKVPRT